MPAISVWIFSEGFPMRQLRLAISNSRTLGDMRLEGRERLMTVCDKCGNTSNHSLDQLVTEYRAETCALVVLAILQTRCTGLMGICEMKLRE